ncbi:hypothetical protein HK104_010644 [Borealophlyctis nickersoniae]|nr:hypothetical protein HK104_010644 [Borealophlyctis nickersoniae]
MTLPSRASGLAASHRGEDPVRLHGQEIAPLTARTPEKRLPGEEVMQVNSLTGCEDLSEQMLNNVLQTVEEMTDAGENHCRSHSDMGTLGVLNEF